MLSALEKLIICIIWRALGQDYCIIFIFYSRDLKHQAPDLIIIISPFQHADGKLISTCVCQSARQWFTFYQSLDLVVWSYVFQVMYLHFTPTQVVKLLSAPTTPAFVNFRYARVLILFSCPCQFIFNACTQRRVVRHFQLLHLPDRLPASNPQGYSQKKILQLWRLQRRRVRALWGTKKICL